MSKNDPSFHERMQTSAKAKQAQLATARTNAPANDPGFAARQAERLALSEARDIRLRERAVAKAAIAAREAEGQAAQKLVQRQQLEAEAAASAAELVQKAAAADELKANQKIARDAKYAARKARQR